MEESEKKSLVAEIAQLVVNTLKPLCQSRSQKAAEHERLIDPGFRVILLSNTPGKVNARRSCVCSRRWVPGLVY